MHLFICLYVSFLFLIFLCLLIYTFAYSLIYYNYSRFICLFKQFLTSSIYQIMSFVHLNLLLLQFIKSCISLLIDVIMNYEFYAIDELFIYSSNWFNKHSFCIITKIPILLPCPCVKYRSWNVQITSSWRKPFSWEYV